MQISSITLTQQNNSLNGVKNLYTEKLTKDEAKELKLVVEQNANAFTFQSVTAQSQTLSVDDQFTKDYEEFQTFLKDIGYTGKSIADLSKDEASALVAEDGIFGVSQTSQRMADFVINGANGDESLLRAGRDGVIQGYKDAEAMWGGELPEISQKSLDAALEKIDKAMYDLGYSILDQEA